MTTNNDAFFRQIARLVGSGTSRTAEVVSDRAQDFALLVLQRMAARSIGNRHKEEALAQAANVASVFMKGAVWAPIIAGRVAAGATYVGLSVGDAALRRAGKLFRAPRSY